MTDAVDRNTGHTLPPTDILAGIPAGDLLCALVYRGMDRLVGAVWVAVTPQMPRAGIVLHPDDWDLDFQAEMGAWALRLRRRMDVDPAAVLSALTDSYSGIGNTLSVGATLRVTSLNALRAVVGRPPL